MRRTVRVLLASALVATVASSLAGCSSQSSLTSRGSREPGDREESPSGSSSRSPSSLSLVRRFEGGTLYRTRGTGGKGSFNVVSLKGNWRQMGRQYGSLLKQPMRDFYDKVITQGLAKRKGVDLADVKRVSDGFCRQQSPNVRQLISGMSETSGFALEQQKLISVLVHVADTKPGCSSMAAWADYTGGGPLVVGRNWDMGGPYKDFKEFLTVVVYDPDGSSHTLADVNYVGTISIQTGMTGDGLFLDLQNGQHSDPKDVAGRRLPTFNLFDLLLESSSMDKVDSYLTKPANLPQIALIINVADASEDRVYEWGTFAVKRRTAAGLIASSNYFVSPAWKGLQRVEKGAKGDWSRERMANLLALGERYKGKIDAKRMMAIFDTTYEDGGATFPDFTAYQVVAEPATRTLWLKGRDYSGWEKVDLRSL